jgi:hypothetical protein
MANPFTQQLKAVDQSQEERCFPKDCKTDNAKAAGYSVLNRADPQAVFDRNRRGIAPPARLMPNIDYEEN